MSSWFVVVCAVSVVGFGLVAGIFFAFSDFIMRSLNETKTEAAIEAMQSINRVVYRSIFYYLLWSMLAVAVGLGAYASFNLSGPALGAAVMGTASYFGGVLIVSLAINVPMNQHLDQLDCHGPDAAAYWNNTFVPRWTFWNHVRTATSAGASVCYLVACAQLLAGTP